MSNASNDDRADAGSRESDVHADDDEFVRHTRAVNERLEFTTAGLRSKGARLTRGFQVAVLGMMTEQDDRDKYLEYMQFNSHRLGGRFDMFASPPHLGFAMRRNVRRHEFEIEERLWWPAIGSYSNASVPRAVEYWALLTVAGEVAVKIQNLDAWHSGALDAESGIRIDLAAVLGHLAEQALGAIAVCVELGEPPSGDSSEAAHARSLIEARWATVDRLRDELVTRLVALDIYRERLSALDEQERVVAQAHRVGGTDSRIDELVRNSGMDDVQNAALDRATDNLRISLSARSSALATVRGDYLAALD